MKIENSLKLAKISVIGGHSNALCSELVERSVEFSLAKRDDDKPRAALARWCTL